MKIKVKYYKPIINWSDMQGRIYKNNGSIKWINKVHETLQGYETISYLPEEDVWSIHHHKTIEKQEQQNLLYTSL